MEIPQVRSIYTNDVIYGKSPNDSEFDLFIEMSSTDIRLIALMTHGALSHKFDLIAHVVL